MNLQLTTDEMIGLAYLISIPYVIWRMITRYNKTSLDGIIGTTPGFDTVIYVGAAPFWAVLDLIVTGIMMIIRRIKAEKGL